VEHCGETFNQQKGGTLKSEGGGMKSGNRIPLGQFIVEEGPNHNRLGDDFMVNDNPDDDEAVDNGLEDEVAVKHILEIEEELVSITMKLFKLFMILKQQIPIMLRELLKSM